MWPGEGGLTFPYITPNISKSSIKIEPTTIFLVVHNTKGIVSKCFYMTFKIIKSKKQVNTTNSYNRCHQRLNAMHKISTVINNPNRG